jgi:predicted acyltransferase
MSSAASASTKTRLASLDQFRGYTVAGMFLVNYLGYDWMPAVLLHHHTYCSYADTIMPQFLFAVGFAMRLSFGRRVQTHGLAAGYWRMVRRILGLLLVSFAIYTEGRAVENWEQLVDLGAWNVVAPYLKRHWLQTLGQIAITSLWILPVIRAGAGVRILFTLASGIAHVGLSHLFNYHWVNTDPNGVDGGPLGFLTWTIPTIVGTLACDAVVEAPRRPRLGRIMLTALTIMGLGYVFSCGTRLYDLSEAQIVQLKEDHAAEDAAKKAMNGQIDARVKKIAATEEAMARVNEKIAEARRVQLREKFVELRSKPENADRPRREVIDGAEKQLQTTPPNPAITQLAAEAESLKQREAEIPKLKSEVAGLRAQLRAFRDVKLAPTPVIPPHETWRSRNWKTLLAEPPFVEPPHDDPRVDSRPYDMQRYWNYWMMTQRGGSLSYLTFGAGFALLVYVLFYVLADMLHVRLGLFRTFGTNALAAYVLAGIIGGAVKTFVPGDAPPLYVISSFVVHFSLVWLFVRTLEKNGIFLRV